MSGPAVFSGTLADLGTGRYVGEYTPSVAGSYALRLQLQGRWSKPLNVSVAPGPVSAPHCSAEGAGLVAAASGTFAALTVTARDRFGNDRSAVSPGGGQFAATVLSADGSTAQPGWNAVTASAAGGASYRVLVSGQYQLKLEVGAPRFALPCAALPCCFGAVL